MNTFSNHQITWAREYWSSLSDTELHEFHKHYTVGSGLGTYSGVNKDTSFTDYLVISAMQSDFETRNDI